MKFSASGTQREDKDLLDVGLNWMLRQLEDDIQIVVDARSQGFGLNWMKSQIKDGTVNFDLDSALEPLTIKTFF